MKPGPGKEPQFQPHEGILFVNEFHDWGQVGTNLILKEFLSSGRLKINSANGGLTEIFVPLTTYIASNDGIELLRPREKSASKAPTDEQMLERWKHATQNPQDVKDAIKSRSDVVIGKVHDAIAGITDEALDRFDDDELVLLRPLPENIVQDITSYKITGKLSAYRTLSEYLNADLSVPRETINFIAGYKHRADQGARKVNGKVRRLFESVILEAIERGELEPFYDRAKLEVTYRQDGANVTMLLTNKVDGSVKELAVTKTDDLPDIYSKDELARFTKFNEDFKAAVFGADELADNITDALFLSEANRRKDGDSRARRFAFLGITGSGKTHSAKQIAKFYMGSEEALESISFNNVRSADDVKKLIYGTEHGGPSEFMKAYRKHSGKFVILFDEATNVPDISVLQPLYDLLDEATVRGFNDGKPRAMDNVIIVMTGNGTENIYNVIGKHLPEKVQRQAQLDIHRKFNSDDNMKQEALEQHLKPALIARLGKGAVIFPPLDHAALRAVVHAKFEKFIRETEETLKEHNIKVVFESDENYEKLVNAVETACYDLLKQGRSIENAVAEVLVEKVLGKLRKMPLEDNGEIVIHFKELKKQLVDENERYDIVLGVESAGETHELVLKGKGVPEVAEENIERTLQVAIHEAGHEIVRRSLLASRSEPVKIGVVPGLAKIGDRYVHYAGIAVSKLLKDDFGTRTEMISELAVLYAGAEAQRLVNKGQIADMGQRNDIERASNMAKLLVIKFGLGNAWGLDSAGPDETLAQYLSRLSEKRKLAFENEILKIEQEARALANATLRSNFTQLLELGRRLAFRGELFKEDLLAFYKEYPILDYWKTTRVGLWVASLTQTSNWNSWWAGLMPKPRSLDPVLISSFITKEDHAKVVNVENLLEARKQEAVKAVAVPKSIKTKAQSCTASILALPAPAGSASLASTH